MVISDSNFYGRQWIMVQEGKEKVCNKGQKGDGNGKQKKEYQKKKKIEKHQGTSGTLNTDITK